MDALSAIFPAQDFSLLLAIVLLPLIGAVINGVFGKRLGKEAVTLMALVAVGGSFLASILTFLLLAEAQTGERAARFVWHGWRWLSVSGRGDMTSVPIEIAFSIDALSGTMALVVTGVGFLIHLYSTKYMETDPGYHRFFAYLNLFIFSMLVLILGDNLPVLFVGWEGVGLCSYLLIGFWFHEEKNAQAGKKAFITNRIGDFGLLVAMGLLVYYAGALDWTSLETARHNLLTPVKVWPVGTHVPMAAALPETWEKAINAPVYVSAATLVGLMLFLGCAGKSAQIPLYVWLPDAMAGPTPVSALIHAATMVTAGVYLVCRMAGVFVLSPFAMMTVASIGALTAVFAATIALVQNDIKKVLAYSTVSQLGYMFLGVGVGAFSAGFFHVLTHAFFKACLFLGAGSVIHAMHARIHDTDASQDIRYMGGLQRFLPITFWTFVAAWAAIVGFPFTSGFFSKDEILLQAKTLFVAPPTPNGRLGGVQEITLWLWPDWLPTTLYTLGVAGAVMTAFYMTRLLLLTFFGEFRGWNIVKNWKPALAHAGAHEAAHPLEPSELEHDSAATHEARGQHAHDEHDEHDDHHHEPYIPGEPIDGPRPHESPWQMTLPLVVLGALAVLAGFLNAHLLHWTALDQWLAPVFRTAAGHVRQVAPDASQNFMFLGLAVAVAAFAIGVGIAWWMYMMQKGAPARALAERAPGLYRLVYDKWRIDELYDEVVIGAVDALAEFAVFFDKWVVDGVVARLTSFVVAASGTLLRQFQTGRVQAYAATMVVGLAGMCWYLLMPHAEASVQSDHASGNYQVTAAPGFGYQYRWDANGDGKWDAETYGAQQAVELQLKTDETRQVRLEVKNALGQVSTRHIEIVRPKPDASGPMSRPTTLAVEKGPDGTLRARAPDGQVLPTPQQRLGQPGQPAAPGQPARPGQPTPAQPPQQYQLQQVHP
jgi:NADH-quinone oxidoreductase subunit L